jgi:hypothetical protein
MHGETVKKGQGIYFRQKASLLQLAVSVAHSDTGCDTLILRQQTAATYNCKGTKLLNNSFGICSK